MHSLGHPLGLGCLSTPVPTVDAPEYLVQALHTHLQNLNYPLKEAFQTAVSFYTKTSVRALVRPLSSMILSTSYMQQARMFHQEIACSTSDLLIKLCSVQQAAASKAFCV